MLAMARALMLRPVVLLLDEPSMGLAPRLVEEVFETIARLKAEKVTISSSSNSPRLHWPWPISAMFSKMAASR